MMPKKLVVTGSSGLIGSEACIHFHRNGWHVHGIDNNQRSLLFGPSGDTHWRQQQLASVLSNYTHHDLDIRSRKEMTALIASIRPHAVIHAAAQPSHDLASSIPFDDFDINAVGTLNLLEATRRLGTELPFVYLSTNKVYGDGPNRIALKEKKTRWEYADEEYQGGIPESFPIDNCHHSLFGASKLAADIVVQEYGRTFAMPTACIRCGCVTGPSHSAVELHGFLNYLVQCNLQGTAYTVFGYDGKQVRDTIHARDVVCFIDRFITSPRTAQVYNLGGGKANTCSILEAFQAVEALTRKKSVTTFSRDHRPGDHICYYSDLTKCRRHYPGWEITISLKETIEDLVNGLGSRLAGK
jgi:CDP-paratose 2-epimerase